jgi:hypothetical protein
MKKSTIVFVSLVTSLTTLISCGSDKNANNEIASKEQSLDKFIPDNWVIVDTAIGDLNNDNVEDVAIVIQNTDKKNIILSDTLNGADFLNINPRSLIVLFKDPNTNEYKQIIKNDKFIPIDGTPPEIGPYGDIEIKKGNLKLNFSIFYSAGRSDASSNSYLFRYQNNDLALIGAETSYTHRMTGESVKYSINFLTKKYSITSGNEFDEKVKPKTEWKTFELNELKTLSTLPEAYTWEFNDIVL